MGSREPMNIILRRREEDRRVAASAAVSERARVTAIVDFETRTTRKMHGSIMRQRIAEANRMLRAQVDDRRRRLADLLAREREQHEKEVEASYESPEKVKERMFAYARKLKEENEAARKKLAEELEKKRFRNMSDVLRARASAITAERVALDRVAQLQEKQRLAQLEREREAADAAARLAEATKYLDRARVEAEARRRLEQEMKAALDAQVAVKRDVSAAERAKIAEDDARALAEWKAAQEAAVRAEAARRIAAREEYERVQEFNQAEAAVRASAAAAEADLDVRHLDAALKREAGDLARERAAAEARKAETLEFRRKLQEQMEIAAEETGWIDKFYADEAEKEWQRRKATWDAEAAAREALMKEVNEVRLHQMEDRKVQAAADAIRDERQVAIWRADLEAAQARERARQEEKQRAAAQHADALKRQMDLRAEAAERTRQQQYLEWRLQQKEEREYSAKVEALLREPVPTTVHARKKTGLW